MILRISPCFHLGNAMDRRESAVVSCVKTIFSAVFLVTSLWAADDPHQGFDGTYRGRVISELVRHRQEKSQGKAMPILGLGKRFALREDIANIAILDNSDGIVLTPNTFDLNESSVLLRSLDDGYTVESTPLNFDQQAQEMGLSIPLSDDDAVSVVLPFRFPFFGKTYETIWVHSDGNLSFVEPDTSSSTRSLSRAAGGPPRIAPLFTDLNPSESDAKITMVRTSDRTVFTWDNVPEYSWSGNGQRQTFQVVLYLDGQIDFHYSAVSLPSMVVGIMPGSFQNEISTVDFSAGDANVLLGALAEIFTQEQEIDPVAAVLKFYRNHDDAYDYIVLFNDLDLEAGFNAFAYELNIRNEVEGIGSLQPTNNPVFDFGKDFGSASRLQSFINMGPLSNYPDDPDQKLCLGCENSTLSVLGHEAGHRFLAFVSFYDQMRHANEVASQDLLGREGAHWSFFFNSDASLLEGNRIADSGNVSPRFETTAAVEKFSDIDQYLMGLRESSDVTPSFYIESPSEGRPRSSSPSVGVTFDGIRREVDVDMIIAAEGTRRPQSNLAQKKFNFAFVLLVAEGETPSAQTLAKLESIRTEWEIFFHEATDQRAVAHTSLVRGLHLSTWPAAGVRLGGSARATVRVDVDLTDDLDVMLSSESNILQFPPMVTIAAGEREAAFDVQGLGLGVTTISAHVLHSGYDTAQSTILVRNDHDELSITVESGDSQSIGEGGILPLPVVFRLRDQDKLHYGGVPVALVPSGDGVVTPSQGTTDALGRIAVQWRPSYASPVSAGAHVLRIELVDTPAVQGIATAIVSGSRPEFTRAGIVNAASFNTNGATPDRVFAPGGLYSIFGANLTTKLEPGLAFSIPLPRELVGTVASINGEAAPLLFVSDGQLNMLAPFDLPIFPGVEVMVSVASSTGVSEEISLPTRPVQPGIFVDAQTGFGAILNSQGRHVAVAPLEPGEVIQIFATGLGLVDPPVLSGTGAPLSPLSSTLIVPSVKIGNLSAEVIFSGLAPLFAGLYQVNVRLPDDLTPGIHTLSMEAQSVSSNQVLIEVQ